MNVAGMIFIGLLAGITSGALGIGGAVLIIPALVYFGGMGQKMAQGTTLLLMLPPIGLFAALEYWKRGEANWVAAAWICLGFLIGGFLGARWVGDISPAVLRKAFGVLMVAIGIRMFFRP